MTNMSEFINAADHAASQSDRWAFFMALIILGVFAILVMRYFVEQGKRQSAEHKESREAHLSALREHQSAIANIITEQNKTSTSLAVCLDRNTGAMNECTEELKRCREQRK